MHPKHSYSGILHQVETPNHPDGKVNLIPITYFSGSFRRTLQLWNTTHKECYAVYWSIQKFVFYIAGTKCTLYCDHKLLDPFFTMGMSSPVLDRWALELQQFDIKFQHIQGKKNVVADAVSRLRILGLYQDSSNEDVSPTVDDVIENIIEEVHSMGITPKRSAYNVGKLSLDVFGKEQKWDPFCKKKVKELKTKHDPNFLLNGNSVLRNVAKLKYSVESTKVVPRLLTSLIIMEFHNAKGH